VGGGGADPGTVQPPGDAFHCPGAASPNRGAAALAGTTSDTISAGRKQKNPNRNHKRNERPLCNAMAAGMHASPISTARKTSENVPEYSRPLTLKWKTWVTMPRR